MVWCKAVTVYEGDCSVAVYGGVSTSTPLLRLRPSLALELPLRMIQPPTPSDAEFVNMVFEREGPIKRIVHLAARAGVRPSIQDPFIYIHSNLHATTRLLEYVGGAPLTLT